MNISEPEFVTIGEILAPCDETGRLKVRVITDFPERFAPSSTVYIRQQPATIESCTWQKGKAIIKLNTIDTIDEARLLLGQPVEIHHSQLKPLPEGQYYHFQLIGLEVRTSQGESLGNISEILTTASNDVYITQGTRGDILIPAIEDVVISVDLGKGIMIIEPLAGML